MRAIFLNIRTRHNIVKLNLRSAIIHHLTTSTIIYIRCTQIEGYKDTRVSSASHISGM